MIAGFRHVCRVAALVMLTVVMAPWVILAMSATVLTFMLEKQRKSKYHIIVSSDTTTTQWSNTNADPSYQNEP